MIFQVAIHLHKNGVEEHEAMKMDIDVMKKVIEEHSEKLQQLA